MSISIRFLNSKKPLGTEILHVPLSLVYVARDMIIDYAIKGEFTHVMFIDSDMVFNSDLLIKLAEHDKDIVSGLAVKRKPPYTPCVYEKLRIGELGEGICEIAKTYTEGLNQAEGVGMACCLIKTAVFKKSENPVNNHFSQLRGLVRTLLFVFARDNKDSRYILILRSRLGIWVR